MHFNFDHVPNRRIPAHSIKWNKYPEDVLPMWIADMDFPAPEPVLVTLHEALNPGVLGYEHPAQCLQETVAART